MEQSQIFETLNERELEIIPLIAEGLTNAEIADRLFLAHSTVKWYIRQINSKLATTSREEILSRVQELGLLNMSQQHPAYLRPRENLPRQTTPFVGRDAELDEIHAILEKPNVRLLTILAPGGMGKTRIALEATEQQVNNFKDGVYFVALQPLSDVEGIIPQIANATGYPFSDDGRSPQQQVLDFLSEKRILLCMDNWEHLLEGVGLVNEILSAAPEVKVIATSREKLNLMGETVYALQGMQFPAWETPDDALRYDAVQLLMQAATRVQPNWQITRENLDYVARVCRLTQGMPLAIILAASWLDTYPLDLICEELQNSSDILETQMRDVPERQRSIRAVFDYSWQRLSLDEQHTLASMSVFRGGCSPRAALEVTQSNLRVLQGLVNKALISRSKNGRYELHELLRQYASEKLQQSGDVETLHQAHMHYYLNTLTEKEAHLRDQRQIDALSDIKTDFENLRHAWEQACMRHEYALIEKVIFSLDLTLNWGGFSNEECRRIWDIARQHLLNETSGDHPTVAKIAWRFLPSDKIMTPLKHGLTVAKRHNDLLEAGICLNVLANVYAYLNHDRESACTAAKEGIQILRSIDEPLLLSRSLNRFGNILQRFGEPEEALTHLEEALKLAEKHNNLIVETEILNSLVAYFIVHGQLKHAERLSTRAVSLGQKLPPNFSHAYNLAELFWARLCIGQKEGNEEIVEEILEHARFFNDEALHGAYLASRMLLLNTRGRYQEAWQDVDEGVEKLGKHAEAVTFQIFMAITACGVGALERASEFFLNFGHLGVLRKSQYFMTLALFMPAFVLAQRDEPARATQLLSLCYTHPRASSAFWDTIPLFDDLHTQLENTLGEAGFEKQWELGKSLDLETVVNDLLVQFGEET